MSQCKAHTKSGKQCNNKAVEGSSYCHIKSHHHPLKGNNFAIGNSGKPKKWKTPQELKKDIYAYFEECDANKKKIYSKRQDAVIEVAFPLPYTIEGLCCHLDCNRLTLNNYQKQEGYEEYFNTIMRARRKIKRDKMEKGLTGENNASMAKFDFVNNFEYQDAKSLDHTTGGEKMNIKPIEWVETNEDAP